MIRRRLAIAALLFASACSRPAADPAPPAKDASSSSSSSSASQALTSTAPKTIYRSHFTMGSQITITAYTTDEAGALEAFAEAFARFDELDRLLSVWKEGSDIAKLNAAAGKSKVSISPVTMDALERARRLSELTRGKFDVTFGALSGLWKFDHDQDNTIPPDKEIAKRISLIDYRKLILDPAAGTAFLEREGMKAHLGGIGKGFAVDQAVEIIRKRGLAHFMVQAGGDLYVSGRHGDRMWRVGIRDPRGPPERYFAAAEVTDATFSTSGDYERSFIKDGVRYHHILDPATGKPAMKSRSVTVMARDATTAEGLSKGVFILGAEEGLKLLERVEGAGAVIVDADNGLHISPRLEGKVKILFPPTGGI